MRLHVATAILLFVLLSSIPATLAQAGSSSDSVSKLSKLAKAFRKVTGPKEPQFDILEHMIKHHMPNEVYKKLSPEYVQAVENGWVNRVTGLPIRNDMNRPSAQELEIVDRVVSTLGQYAHLVPI